MNTNGNMNGAALRDCIARIVTLANHAPSGENCQPWLFHWDGRNLSVRHDAERARHKINHNGHASLLALGGVLVAIEMAATAEGMAAEVRLSPDDRTGLWATVRLEAAAVSASERAAALDGVAAIQQRATDRRLYRGGSATHPVLVQLRRDAEAFETCRLHIVAHPSTELVRYLAATDGYVLRHDDVLADVLRWVRFRDDEVNATRDGVSWRAVGFDLPSLRAVEWLRSPGTWRVLRALGLRRVTRAWLRLQVASSAALCAITTRPGRREDLVAAGRLAFTAWTALNRAGFGVQPMTHPALSVYNLASGGLPPGTRPEFVELFREGRATLARSFGWSDGELPVWLMRTGLSGPLPPRLHTLRLPTPSVLTFS